MNVTFKDFYGQQINVNNETASGNVRLEVKTCSNLNDVRTKSVKDYDLTTDLSLTEKQVRYLIATLENMIDEDEE